MRHERFDRDSHEFERVAEAEEKRRPSLIGRFATLIVSRLAGGRANLCDFSAAQLRDIGLTRQDVERF